LVVRKRFGVGEYWLTRVATVTLPKPMTSGAKSQGRFGRLFDESPEILVRV
jgi:hypothetical protein